LSKHDPLRKYSRKSAVAARYGVSERTIDRYVQEGRLPRPVYLPGSRIPLFEETALEECERLAAARPPVAEVA
jgi:predicted DNA-binding transcriptional regulator AlpA